MKNMERLYYQFPYVKTFHAEVTSCDKRLDGYYDVCLDQTGFYPEGGGQPSDTGIIDQVTVLEVHEKDGTILHKTDGELKPGSCVSGKINWDRRLDYMQQHTGEHLISGLVHRHFGYDNVGFHMGSQEVTVDFNGSLTAEQVLQIEEEANQLIYENLPVFQRFPDEEELHKLDYRSKKELSGQVRIIEIPGGDICACCGTHVSKTGEVGVIKLIGGIRYKGGIRLSMLCGKKALMDYQSKHGQIIGISNLLSVKPELALKSVESLKKECQDKNQVISDLYRKLFKEKIKAYPDSSQLLIVFEEQLASLQLRQFCTLLYEQKKGAAVVLCSGKNQTYQYAIGSESYDMRQFGRLLNQRLQGKGGGSPQMVQGTFLASPEEIKLAAGDTFAAIQGRQEEL